MAFKTILNLLGEEPKEEDLQIAMKLGSEVDAHIIALLVALARVPTGRYETLSPSWLEVRERKLNKLDDRVAKVRERFIAAGLSFDVDSLYAEIAGPAYDIGERAIYADLVVAGPGIFADDELKPQVISGGLFHAGRPVLFVPPDVNVTLRPKTVLLAWDSRPSAAHAAREALELMQMAQSVHVTMVDPVAASRVSGDEPGADIATYLARHDIDVSVETLPSSGHFVTDTLLRHAVDINADMIVMGAYGHSKLLELILGGVTKSMLKEANLPILMAH
ncbi:universal stress protein [Ensifer sp. NPDC090286]|uniref:universal stress protein n=1 Tax=Ensifer sp. NPDC090286 TaxID=3363991 RepID=UPI00383B4910